MKSGTLRRSILAVVLVTLLACLTACQESTGSKYERANKLLAEGKYTEAADIFDEISTYEDASKISLYAKAINAAESGDYETAFATFESLGDFKDCPMMITYYTGREAETSVMQFGEIHPAYWFDAIKAYESIPLFRDSKDRAEACRAEAYEKAIEKGDAGDTWFAISVMMKLESYRDAAKQVRYYEAKQLYINGNYIEASEKFGTIPGFRDADDLKATSDASVARDEMLKPYQTIGSIVTFGVYPQTTEGTDQTPIEWIVLDVQEGKALLISRFALDEKKYNEDWEDVTWETSTLRAWLNDEFISIAFSEEERTAILISSIDNSDSQGYSYNTTGGNDTEDKVFLLSYYEAFEQYFSDNEARMCAPTDYAIANGANPDEKYQAEGRNTCPWFLRSPQKDYQQFAMAVDSDGSRFFLNADQLSIRPALWLDLNVHNSSGE